MACLPQLPFMMIRLIVSRHRAAIMGQDVHGLSKGFDTFFLYQMLGLTSVFKEAADDEAIHFGIDGMQIARRDTAANENRQGRVLSHHVYIFRASGGTRSRTGDDDGIGKTTLRQIPGLSCQCICA